jgi:hypothetical protein
MLEHVRLPVASAVSEQPPNRALRPAAALLRSLLPVQRRTCCRLAVEPRWNPEKWVGATGIGTSERDGLIYEEKSRLDQRRL